jgi:phenylalanyl-tRNA synthetase beta chain
LTGSEKGQISNYSAQMAIVTFELKDLERLGVSKEDITSIVDRLGMSLEELNEKSVTVDITPNRPDMLGIVGFSRAALFLLGKKVPKEKFYSITSEPMAQVTVTKTVKKIRPFIAAAVVKNVDLSGNKLKDLINFTEKFCETYGRKRKKIAIGLYNFDVAKGNFTYDASRKGEFAPLGSKEKESFDKILKEHEKGIEYSDILNKRKAYPNLRDEKNIFSLIPIINSEHSRVTENTKNLFVELTGTSQKVVEEALNLIACTFIDMGADVYPCNIVYPNKTVITPHLDYKEVKIRRSTAEKMLGVYLEDNKVITLANKLGHVAAKYGIHILFYSPPYRLDILNEQDVIEDIAIAYGYDKIEPIPVASVLSGTADESKDKSNGISMLMLGTGFSEAMNTYLTNDHTNFERMARKEEKDSTIRVAYSKTEAITILRTNLLPLLMQNLSNSTNERMPQKLFEIGATFYMDGENIVESTNIAIVSEHSKANYSEIKSIVSQLFKFMDLKNYSLKEIRDPAFIAGRAAKIVSGNEELGYFGEMHPKVLENFKIDEPVVAAEIKLDKCMKLLLKSEKK